MTTPGARRARSTDRSLGPRLVALFGLALLLFNFPLLSLWDRDAVLFGLPLLPVALFVIWAVLIGLLALTLEGRAERKER